MSEIMTMSNKIEELKYIVFLSSVSSLWIELVEEEAQLALIHCEVVGG